MGIRASLSQITGSGGNSVTRGVILFLSAPMSPTTCRGRQIVGKLGDKKWRIRQQLVGLCSFTARREL